MENWIKDMPQFHHQYLPPFDSFELPELDYSFFNDSDLLDLENTAHCNNNNNLSAPASIESPGESFNVDDLFVEGHCENEKAQFYSAAPAPAPMISFVENPTAVERESAPPNGVGAARKVWTVHEHKLFLVGMEIYGKSNWREIAKRVVMTKTPSQVASHAQKYFLRQQSAGQKQKRSRSSIHDITTIDPELLLQVLASQHPPPTPFQPPPLSVVLSQQFGVSGDQDI